MLRHAAVPVIGFAAFSGTGKTTLLRQVLPLLTGDGLRVGMIKHAHHSFDVDTPGKDSHELRQAGASRMLVASRQRWALMTETPGQNEPHLDSLLTELNQRDLDVILVEGFKHERFAKIEVHRPSLGHPLLFPDDDTIIAVAADAPLAVDTSLPVLDLNRPRAVADFVLDYVYARDTKRPSRSPARA